MNPLVGQVRILILHQSFRDLFDSRLKLIQRFIRKVRRTVLLYQHESKPAVKFLQAKHGTAAQQTAMAGKELPGFRSHCARGTHVGAMLG